MDITNFLFHNPVGNLILSTGYGLLQGYIIKNKTKVSNQLIPILNVAIPALIGSQVGINPEIAAIGGLSSVGAHQLSKTAFKGTFTRVTPSKRKR